MRIPKVTLMMLICFCISILSSCQRSPASNDSLPEGAEKGYVGIEEILIPIENESQTSVETRREAEPADAEAQYNLGNMYVHGEGVPHDLSEAVKWFRKAAQQGHVNAQLVLGRVYAGSGGEEVHRDYSEAVKWFRKAAEQGNARAKAGLGGMYADGKGVPQNYIEAVKWYQMAAEQGYPAAKCQLGNRYYKGNGVPQDYTLAYMWLDLCVSDQTLHPPLIRFMAKIHRDGGAAKKMSPEQIAEAQKMAAEWMEKRK